MHAKFYINNTAIFDIYYIYHISLLRHIQMHFSFHKSTNDNNNSVVFGVSFYIHHKSISDVLIKMLKCNSKEETNACTYDYRDAE